MKLLVGMVLLSGAALAQVGITESIDLKGLKAEVGDYKGRRVIQLTETLGGPGGGLCILKREQIQDGASELMVAGGPGPGAGTADRGFVGLAFRVRPGAERYQAFTCGPPTGGLTIRSGTTIPLNTSPTRITPGNGCASNSLKSTNPTQTSSPANGPKCGLS